MLSRAGADGSPVAQKKISHELGLTPIEPRAFELVLNYRSHGGIVNCARSVIELIMCYWPYSIDALKPERAIVDGFRPMFFASRVNVRSVTLWPSCRRLTAVNRLTWRSYSPGTTKGKSSISGRTNV